MRNDGIAFAAGRFGDREIGRNDSKNPPKLQVAKAIHQRRKGAK